MSDKNPLHISYLLRIWQVEGEGRRVWRATIEDARTGERQGFATLAHLLAYLQERIGALAGSTKDKGGER